MRTMLFYLLLLVLILQNETTFGQCTDFQGIPNPIPELPVPFCGADACGQPFFIPAPVQTASAFELQGLVAGNTYQFSLCDFLVDPFFPFDLVVVDIQNPNNPLFTSNQCFIQFTPTFDGTYLLLVNEQGNCSNPMPSFVAEGFTFELACPSLCPSVCPFPMNRAKAVSLLLSPNNGVPIDLFTNVWSPMVDFGFGFGNEGLLPAGTIVEPPYPSAFDPFQLPFEGYFFWLDQLPFASFVHPTSFVFIDANNCNPTLDNGGLVVLEQEWWPVITLPGSPAEVFFNGDLITNEPPGARNMDGLIEGDVSGDVETTPEPSGNTSSNEAAGLVVTGGTGTEFENDIREGRRSLQDEFDVDSFTLTHFFAKVEGNSYKISRVMFVLQKKKM